LVTCEAVSRRDSFAFLYFQRCRREAEMNDIKLDPDAAQRWQPPVQSELFGKPTFGRRIVGALKRFDAWAKGRDLIVCTDGRTFDDRAALAYLALSAHWRLVGVVSTAVPASAAKASESDPTSDATPALGDLIRLDADPVVAALESLPLRKQPPVVQGSAASVFAADVATDAADFIIEKSRKHWHRNRMVVVLLGAATDVALALSRDDRVEDSIEIVAGAFDKWPEGGDTDSVSYDVAAWQVILDSSVPLTIASTAAARQCLRISPARALQRLRGKSRDEDARKAFEWLDNAREEDVSPGGRPAPLRGLLAVAHVLGCTETEIYPRPTIGDDTGFLHGGSTAPLPCQTCVGEPRIRWVNAVNEKRFWGELASLVAGQTMQPTKRSTGKPSKED
jgi:inosine-uridine nucleoside N-ribohydrolase